MDTTKTTRFISANLGPVQLNNDAITSKIGDLNVINAAAISSVAGGGFIDVGVLSQECNKILSTDPALTGNAVSGFALPYSVDTGSLIYIDNVYSTYLRAPLKMHFFRDCGVSSVLQSSGITYTLRWCARGFLALTKQ